ncbi:ABC transporter permease [Nonomuraea sp. NPDC050310]|uniref:ABC transporter permease n=1 Tax=unclassified Nonomuraea TaxID=2593643 RepID=UPI0033CAB2D8
MATVPLAGRSPGQIAWRRFKRNKVGVACSLVVACYFLIAAGAPLISWLYGKNAEERYGYKLLDASGYPPPPTGGMSAEFWLGIEPGLGRDVFMQLVFGIRTSLTIALIATLGVMLMGITLGITAGYVGGRTDYWISRVIDVLLAFPGQLFLIALVPVVDAMLVDPEEATPNSLRFTTLCIVLIALGWMGSARILRSQVLSMREREFVEAAKVSGASPRRIIFREIMPNLWSPIIVLATGILPALVGVEAGLGFLGVGLGPDVPDWGRMFQEGVQYYHLDFPYLLWPGLAMVIFIISFNLMGDAVRDALDPKSGRTS